MTKHIAGQGVNGVQRCSRCGAVLAEYAIDAGFLSSGRVYTAGVQIDEDVNGEPCRRLGRLRHTWSGWLRR